MRRTKKVTLRKVTIKGLSPTAPRHPGTLLRMKLEVAHLDQGTAADTIGVNINTIHDLVNGRRSIALDMAMRLAILFPDTNPFYWLGLQNEYDVWHHPLTKVVA